jgi:hypothetical protein
LITAGGNLESDLVLDSFALVVELELLPYLVRDDADDRVRRRVVIAVATEDVEGDSILVDLVRAPLER